MKIASFGLCKFFLIIFAAAELIACNELEKSDTHLIVIGISDGPAVVLKVSDDYQIENITTPDFLGLNYVSQVNRGAIAAISESEVLLIDFDKAEKESAIVLARSSSHTSPTAIDVNSEGDLFFGAHFFDNKLTVRTLEGTTFLQPQEFECGWAHQFRPHPNGKWAYAACMKNTLMQFSIDEEVRRVEPMPSAVIKLAGGPRHMAFHPNGQTLFLMLQISSEIAVIDINSVDGELIMPPRQIIPTTKQGGNRKTSDIQITPNGKWLYGFNRLDQTMSTFSVAESGDLKLIEMTQMPFGEVRHFSISPEGSFLVTATDKGHAAVWSIEDSDGTLTLKSEMSGLGKAVSSLILP